MATRTSSDPIDVQKLLSGMVKLEIKWLNAGVDAMRVYLDQAARLSELASDTLKAVQDDKATLAGTAKKLTDFGRDSLHTYADLSQRLGATYYGELDRLAEGAIGKATSAATSALKAVPAELSKRRRARPGPAAKAGKSRKSRKAGKASRAGKAARRPAPA